MGKTKLSLLITNFVLLNFSFGQTFKEQVVIDSLFKVYNTASSPGVSLGVIKNGKTFYVNGYGYADIENEVKNDGSTLFWIASVTKQFTAAGIYLLSIEKKINLHNSVRSYIPNLPVIYDSVSIDHLIHHTSGIRDGFVLTALSKRPEEEYTNENVLYFLSKQQQLNFAPGTQFEYNNSGYVLLAKVIEKVSGLSYPQFMSANIFKPLGMKNTFVSGKYVQVNKIAKGYRSNDGSNKPGTFIVSIFKGNTYGSTGIITNVTDLTKWATFFHINEQNSKLALAIKEMKKAGNLNDGTSIAYGGGLEIMNYRGTTNFEHFGADEGFKANILYFPKDQLSVIGLANNTTDYDLSRKLYAIADIYLKKQQNTIATTNEPHPVWKQDEANSIKADSDIRTTIQSYIGEYRSDELETTYKVFQEKDGLKFELIPGVNIPMQRLNNNTFVFGYAGVNRIVFTKAGFEFNREGVRNLLFRSSAK